MDWLADIEKKRIEEEKKWNAVTISHKAADGTDVNGYGYDRNGNKHYGNYQEPQNNNQGTYSSSGSKPVSDADTILGTIVLLVIAGFFLRKYIAANKEFFIIILAIPIACTVVCIIFYIKKVNHYLIKNFFIILASAAMIGALIYIGPAKITRYFNSLKQNSALQKTSAQTPDSSLQETPPQTTAAGNGNAISNPLVVRAGPSNYDQIIGRLQKGSHIEVIDNSGQFWKIKSGDIEGYVDSDYLKNE
jgi:hypothetical protein